MCGFLVGLKQRGLHGVEFVVTDDHEGLRRAIAQLLPEAAWQRCYVHFLRNSLDHLPRKGDDDCLTELRWLYDRWNLDEAHQDLSRWLDKWQECLKPPPQSLTDLRDEGILRSDAPDGPGICDMGDAGEEGMTTFQEET